MNDQDFEKALDAWAAHEIQSAPDMRPSAAMYRMVRARRKRRLTAVFFSRRAALAAMAASLLALLAFYVLARPPSPKESPRGQTLAFVGLRENVVLEKGIEVQGPIAHKETTRGGAILSRLEFYAYRPASELIQGINLQVEQTPLSLSPDDNYRLLLVPAVECYVYVFQHSASGALVELFPNTSYSPRQNPLHPGQESYLPAEPDWFYLSANQGMQRLYVVAASQPLTELTTLYARYDGARDKSERDEALAALLEWLDASRAGDYAGAAGWTFDFGP